MACRWNKERTVTQSAYCPVCTVRLEGYVSGSFDTFFCSDSCKQSFRVRYSAFQKRVKETYTKLALEAGSYPRVVGSSDLAEIAYDMCLT